jgi:hypothetical protein
MDVEWGKKAIVMKYLFKYVTKGSDFSKLYLERIGSKGVPVGSDGQDNHTVIDCGHLDAPASTDMPTSAVSRVSVCFLVIHYWLSSLQFAMFNNILI